MSWILRDNNWRARSRCGGQDPAQFFPSGRPSNDSKAGCAGCPVRQECLDFALESPWEPWGIWGGLSAGQLRPLWEQRHAEANRTNEVRRALGLSTT